MSDLPRSDSSDTGESPAATCRRLIRGTGTAALATLAGDPPGWPYASLVLVACAQDASPVLLLSDLADHSRNIAGDARISLLFDETAGLDDPLTGARVSLQGRARRLDGGDPEDPLPRRYLARHPGARRYVGFADFRFYQVVPDRAHLVAGFGRIHRVDAADLRFDAGPSAPLAEAEPAIVAHMNADHADALQRYATAVRTDAGAGWIMTGIDPEGLDLRRDGQFLRINFKNRVDDAAAARDILVKLAGDNSRDAGETGAAT